MIRRAKRYWAALAVCAGLTATLPSAAAQGSEDEEEELHFMVDGAFTWMGTWGNDVPVGETITIDEDFDLDTGTSIFEESVNGLVAKMRTHGMPWIQVRFDKEKWGIAAELWTLDTDGSAATEDDVFDAFRYHDLADTVEDLTLDLRATNELSVWSARVMFLREVSKSLTLGVGLQTGKLDNRRHEVLNLFEPNFLFVSFSGNVDTKSKTVGTLVGPSFDVRGSATLGRRAAVNFTAAQSVLFATFENETMAIHHCG